MRVSCQSATSCLAVGIGASGPVQVGGAIVTTANGGSTWTASDVPSDSGALEGVTCLPATTICFVSGVSLDALTNGQSTVGLTFGFIGATSGANAGATAGGSADAGAGSSTTAIEATALAGRLGHRVTSVALRAKAIRDRAVFGVVFAPAAANVPPSSTTTVSSDTTPGGGGQIFASGDGGSTWTEQVVPAQSAVVADLSCPSTAGCVGAGADTTGAGQILSLAQPATTTTTTTSVGVADHHIDGRAHHDDDGNRRPHHHDVIHGRSDDDDDNYCAHNHDHDGHDHDDHHGSVVHNHDGCDHHNHRHDRHHRHHCGQDDDHHLQGVHGGRGGWVIGFRWRFRRRFERRFDSRGLESVPGVHRSREGCGAHRTARRSPRPPRAGAAGAREHPTAVLAAVGSGRNGVEIAARP